MFRQTRNRSTGSWKPALECLEDRQLMAAHLFFIGNPALGYYLNLKGTEGNDAVKIYQKPDGLHIDVIAGDTKKGQNYLFTDKMPAFIRFEGYNGNNFFQNQTNIPSIVITGAGNDHIEGGSDRDFIMAGNGDNQIFGGAGDDLIIGGMQRDDIDAGSGNDVVLGLSGTNVIYGGEGNDYLEGGYQIDWIFGGAGNDTLVGLGGDDWLFGNDDNDTIFGGAGEDRLFGGAGRDLLFGGFDFDRVYGGDGDDYLSGGYDSALDWLDGGEGYDVAESYVQLRNEFTRDPLEQLNDGAVNFLSFGILGENIFAPFHAELSKTVVSQDDSTINMEDYNSVFPTYGKDPEYLMLGRVTRSAVDEAKVWSDYVLARAGKVNLQGGGFEVPSRSSTRSASHDPLLQHQTLGGSSSNSQIPVTTQLLNIDLPPVEVKWTTPRVSWLNSVLKTQSWMNPDDLLLAAILNNEGNEETQAEWYVILDQGGVTSWTGITEAADPLFTNWSNQLNRLSSSRLNQELASLDTVRKNGLQRSLLEHQTWLGL
ncbi:MAG TPA: calcium-binding protein [Gemmatales bacterium]|nr:calcium-binding protein [Gemmatales bacterium]